VTSTSGYDVSVIVPAYNEESYLPRSLGALRQSALRLADELPGVAWQLIVVDNGSTDATATIAREYGAFVVAEHHRSISRSRNRGAAVALGSLLVFVDADYRVPLRFLPTVVRRFDHEPALTAAGTRVVLEPTEIDPVTRGCAWAALGLLRRVRSMSFGVFVLRREYFQAVGGFDETAFAYEDVELLERMRRDERLGRGRYRVIDEVTVYASARGFRRGGMLRAYARMAVRRQARRDPGKCGYWYDR
jgi:glycosyltransferase involved in cell wall biosynthesis